MNISRVESVLEIGCWMVAIVNSRVVMRLKVREFPISLVLANSMFFLNR